MCRSLGGNRATTSSSFPHRRKKSRDRGMDLAIGISLRTESYVCTRAPFHVRGAINDRLGAKIVFSGAASNIALTSPSSWKEFNSSKVASDDGLSIEL